MGISTSRLRVFVERASLRVDGDRRTARVRIGSPGTITGAIVLVYQDEEIDCAARTWRLLGFDARDADGRTVQRGPRSGTSTAPALPVTPETIGGRVVTTVCAMTPIG